MTPGLRLFSWFTVRHLIGHPWRTLAVILGIALGASVFTGVRLSVRASLDAFERSMDRLAGRADRVVIHPGGRVDESLVAPLAAHPAVRAASPVLSTYVTPVESDPEPFLLIGFDPILDRPFRSWDTTAKSEAADGIWTALIRRPNTLVAGRPLARALGIAGGDDLLLSHARGPVRFRVAGLLASKDLALVEGGRVALTDIATFQEFTGALGTVDRIDLLLSPAAGPPAMNDLKGLLPPGTVLSPPSSDETAGRRMIRAYQLNLSVLSFVSLFVGMFLVYSLVALNAAARRREVAVLLCVGGTRRTVLALFLGEGVLLGLAGWLAAVPLGALTTETLLAGVSRTISTLFVRVRVEGLALSPWEVILSLAATLAVSLAAAYGPARSATRVSPREELSAARGGGAPTPSSRIGSPAAAGGLMVLSVWPLSRVPAVEGFPLPGYLAVFLLIAGFVLLAPSLLRALGRRTAPLLRRMGGEPARLAGRYARDSGARTAVSVGALLTAVALFVSLAVMIHSFRGTVALWVDQTVTGDLFIRPRMSDLNRYRYPMAEPARKDLENLDDPVDRVPYRRFHLQYDDRTRYQFEAVDMAAFLRHGRFIWTEGDSRTLNRKLARGEGAAVSEVFAAHTGLGPGDRFQALILGAEVDIPILGIIRDYRTRGGVVFFDRSAFVRRTGADQWSGLRIFFRDRGADLDRRIADLRGRIIRKWGHALDVTAGVTLRRAILKIFDETFAVTFVLLFIALVVAALGIATTLTIQVLERSRQLNTLLAMGAERSQIRSMLFWEAGLMVLAGIGSGLACGGILSWLLVYVINRQSFGWTFLYRVDWWTVGLGLPLIAAAALGAALPAARAAFREPPAMLLRER